MKLGLLEKLRRYRINFKKNKFKKYRFKRILINSVVVISYPIFIFFRSFEKSSNKMQIKYPNIYKQLNELKNELNSNYSKKETIEEIKSIKKVNVKDDRQELKKIVENYEIYINAKKRKTNKKNDSINIEKIKFNVENEKNENNVKPVKKYLKIGNIIIPLINAIKIVNPKKNYSTIECLNKKKEVSHKKNKFNNNPSFLKEDLNKLEEKAVKIKLRINTSNYNELYEHEKGLNILESKLLILAQEALKIEINFETISTDSKTYDELKNIIYNLKKEICLKKDELFNENKQADEKKVEKKEPIKMNDTNIINKMNEIIFCNIKKQESLLNSFNKVLLINRKATLLNYLKNITVNILSYILPYKFIKSKVNLFFINSYLINNATKTMRKMVNNNYHTNYEFINEQVLNQSKMMTEISRLNDSSLNEINCLKQEILFMYNHNLDNKEVILLLNNIDSTSMQILKYQEKINTADKNYVKILKNNI